MYRIAALGSHSDALQIGKPAPPVFIVGMADIVTGHRPFTAYFTFLCHDLTPNILKKDHIDLYENGFYTCSGSIRQAFSKVQYGPCIDTFG